MRKNIYPIAVVGIIVLAIGIIIGYKFRGSDNGNGENETTNLAAETTNSEDSSTHDWQKYITLGEYKGLEAKKVIDKVTDANIQEAIDEELVTQEEITNRGIKKGDTANIDFTGKINGKTFEGGSAEGEEIVVGDYYYLKEFEDGIIGAKTGEEVTVPVKFPDDYDNANAAGKKAVFKIKINAILVDKKIELTEKYVKEKLEYDSVAAYKQATRERLEADNVASAEEDLKTTLLEMVIKKSKIITYPDAVYEQASQNMDTEIEDAAAQFGMTTDDYKSQMMGIANDADYKSQVEEQILTDYVYQAIADLENLSVSEEEYQERISDIAAENNYDSVAELEKDYTKEDMKVQLAQERVLQFLVDNAKVTE